MPFSKKGFTLIELLVTIAIIGILSVIAMTSMNGARGKAKQVSFQDTAVSVQRAVTVCCDSGGTTLSPSSGDPVAGGPICRDSISNNPLASYSDYPNASAIGTIKVNIDCGAAQSFAIVLTPGTNTIGGWSKATCDQDGCQYQ